MSLVSGLLVEKEARGMGESSLGESVEGSSEEPCRRTHLEIERCKRTRQRDRGIYQRAEGAKMVVSKECKGRSDSRILTNKETWVSSGRLWGWLI